MASLHNVGPVAEQTFIFGSTIHVCEVILVMHILVRVCDWSCRICLWQT